MTNVIDNFLARRYLQSAVETNKEIFKIIANLPESAMVLPGMLLISSIVNVSNMVTDAWLGALSIKFEGTGTPTDSSRPLLTLELASTLQDDFSPSNEGVFLSVTGWGTNVSELVCSQDKEGLSLIEFLRNYLKHSGEDVWGFFPFICTTLKNISDYGSFKVIDRTDSKIYIRVEFPDELGYALVVCDLLVAVGDVNYIKSIE